MLELKNISKFYHNNGLISSGLTKVNVKFNMGEFVAIVGESGSGKSTLLNVISGLDSYEEGEMLINNEETSGYSEKDFDEYRRMYVSNIFQNFNLVNSYTVYDNIKLALDIKGYNDKEEKKKVLEVIKQVGLYEYRYTKTSKLSGGQKQRVAIARSLVQDTPIIVADEPTGNLDKANAKEIIKLLKKISKDKLVIVVTHNIEQLEDVITRKIRLNDGKIIEDIKIKDYQKTDIKVNKLIGSMTTLDKVKIGIKNTFNIIPKFILLMSITLLLFITIISQYKELVDFDKELNASSVIKPSNIKDEVVDTIILTKKDKSKITETDINELKLNKNIKKVENPLYSTKLIFNFKNIYASIHSINDDIVKIMINDDIKLENQNDVVVLIPNHIKGMAKDINVGEVINALKYNNLPMLNSEIKIVKTYEFDQKISIDFHMLPTVRIIMNEDKYKSILLNNNFNNYTDLNIKIDNKNYEIIGKNNNYDNIILSIDNTLQDGTVKISDFINKNLYQVNINQILTFNSNNHYEKFEKHLKVVEIFKEDSEINVKINQNDYNSLINKNNEYQINVTHYKDKQESTIDSLNDKYDTLVIDELYTKTPSSFSAIMRLIIVIKIGFITGLFFLITLFIIRVILDYRKSYYAILRILGLEKTNVKKIINYELLTISVMSYLLLIILSISNIKTTNNIINGLLNTINLSGFTIINHISLIMIIIIVTNLTSYVYGNHLYKKSALKTFRNEV